MIVDTGKMEILGMWKLSYGKLGTVMILCCSWSLLLIGADSQLTAPVEGSFYLWCFRF